MRQHLLLLALLFQALTLCTKSAGGGGRAQVSSNLNMRTKPVIGTGSVDPNLQQYFPPNNVNTRSVFNNLSNANLPPVRCTVVNEYTPYHDYEKHTAVLTQAAAMEYNKKVHRTLKACPRIWEQNILTGDLSTSDDRLTQSEIHLNAALFQSLTSIDTMQYWPSDRDENKVDAGLAAKLIHLLFTEFEGNYEALLKAVSICGVVTGREAYELKLTVSHTHHHPLGRDQNPGNNVLENLPQNESRKIDSIYFWKECGCASQCHPRLYLINPDDFEETIQFEILRGKSGLYPGCTEEEIRAKHAQDLLDHIGRFPQEAERLCRSGVLDTAFLTANITSPVSRYRHLSELKPLPCRETEHGVTINGHRRTFTQLFVEGGYKSLDEAELQELKKIISTMQIQIDTLIANDTLIPEQFTMQEDLETTTYQLNREQAIENNKQVIQYIKTFPKYLMYLLAGNMVDKHKDLPPGFESINARVLNKKLKIDGQQLNFRNVGVDGERIQPYAPRLTMMLGDCWDLYQGNIESYCKIALIVGPADVNLTPRLAYGQSFDASHRHHHAMRCEYIVSCHVVDAVHSLRL